MTELLFSSGTWSVLLNIKVVDPDGWDRGGNFDESWGEKITRGEFERRCAESTIDTRGHTHGSK